METYTEVLGSKLNDLLEKNVDAEKGYRKAAENVTDSGLKAFFVKKATQRQNFAEDLKKQIRTTGETPESKGSVTGSVHRAWMDLKELFNSDNEEAILEEAIRGEESSVETYKDVLEDVTLPLDLKKLLSQHKISIEEGLNTIKTLEDLN